MEVRSPPLKAFEVDGHFFAFQIRRETDAGDDDVGLLRGLDGLVAECGGGRDPGEVDACRAGAVEVFETDGVGICICEGYRFVVDGSALGLHLGGAGDDGFVVEVEAEAFGIFTCVTVVDTNAELVVAGSGGGKFAGPADGIVVALEAGDGNDFIPVEVDVAVGAGEDGGAGEVGRVLKYSPVRPSPGAAA
jgi:hypothetical protein